MASLISSQAIPPEDVSVLDVNEATGHLSPKELEP